MTGNTINNSNYDGQGKTYEEEVHGSMVIVAILMLVVAGVAIAGAAALVWAIIA